MKFLKICLLPIGGKQEKKTIETLKNLSKTVVKSVEKFEEGVKAYSNQDFERGNELVQEVNQLEEEADNYGFRFESELREGAFLPAFRGDLSKLAESIDDIADMAEESIREIYRRPKIFKDLANIEREKEEAKSIRNGLVELAGKAVEAAETTDEAISVLMENMDKSAEIAEEIHLAEKEADSKQNEITLDLYKYEELLDPISIMQVRLLVDSFGGIADAAEDSGDIISAMTISLKT